MHLLKLLLMSALAIVPLAQADESIPIIGMDPNGKEIVAYVSKEKYIQNVSNQIGAVQAEAVPALSKLKQGKQWYIRTASLGVGIDIQLGLDPIISLGITPRFNAVFSNSKSPVIP